MLWAVGPSRWYDRYAAATPRERAQHALFERCPAHVQLNVARHLKYRSLKSATEFRA